MPVPQIMNYKAKYHVSDIFLHDLEIVLGDLAYADAVQYLDVIKQNNRVIYSALLNEYLASLSNLPYRIISPLMRALSVKENFLKYFEPIEEEKIVPPSFEVQHDVESKN